MLQSLLDRELVTAQLLLQALDAWLHSPFLERQVLVWYGVLGLFFDWPDVELQKWAVSVVRYVTKESVLHFSKVSFPSIVLYTEYLCPLVELLH